MSRPARLALAACSLLVVAAAGGSSSRSTSSTSSTTGRPGSTAPATTAPGSTTPGSTPGSTAGGETSVLPPVMLSATTTSADVKVGTTVTFDLGDPSPGGYVATSSDSAVFKVTSEGGSQGTYSTNAGGLAVAPGRATVSVALVGGSTSPAPVVFTITVR